MCVVVLERACRKDKREQDWYTTWGTRNLHFHKHGNGMVISRILEPLLAPPWTPCSIWAANSAPIAALKG